MNAHAISLRLCVYEERTLLTRIVPANPLRPTMPRSGGNAQSSPTITVCKSNIIKQDILSSHAVETWSSVKIPRLYNLQILLAQQPNQNLDDHQYNSVNIPTTNYESRINLTAKYCSDS
jgi:hypothetical protein